MKIITEKISDKHLNSFWYHEKMIASIDLPNGNTLIAESSGEIEMSFKVDGKNFYGSKAIKKANKNKLNDINLLEYLNSDFFTLTNWFRILEIDCNGECISDDIALASDYIEAIEKLTEVYETIKRG